MLRHILLIFGFLMIFLPQAYAVNPDEMLSDTALELRAREISKNLRCLVCQNQSIDESDADLARDLRVLVRERLVAGDGDQEVINFIVERYGDYVLLKPPFKPITFVLWGGPALIFLMVLFVGFRMTGKRGQRSVIRPLSSDEKNELQEILQADEGSSS